jgi:hypothetical protein
MRFKLALALGAALAACVPPAPTEDPLTPVVTGVSPSKVREGPSKSS